MAEAVVSVMLFMAAGYMVLGILFTIPFQLKGIHQIDEGTHHSSIGFRLIIIPGCILLWPVLLAKWLKCVAGNKTGQ